MARKNTSNPVNYLRINKNGVLYKKADSQTPGAVRVELKDGSTTYHDLFTGGTEVGLITYLGIVEKDYSSGKVKEISISIKGQEETDCIQIPLYTQRGGLSGYAKNLACVLPNVDFSKVLSLKPSTKTNDRGYPYANIFFNYEDKTSVQLAHKYGADGDIPPAEEVEKFGQKAYDFTKQDEYLHKILISQIDRFKATVSPVKEPVVQGHVEDSGIPVDADTNLDDLPF